MKLTESRKTQFANIDWSCHTSIMKYFINGGGREFDQLIELEKSGWFRDNDIHTLLIIPLAIKEDYWQKKWIHPMQFFEKSAGPKITSITTYTDNQEALSTIAEADAIYLTGGSQETLIRRLVDEMDLLDAIKSSKNLKAIGGGSAGMMAMGEKMIVGSSQIKSLVPGLNFVYNTIFDSHFSKHNRLGRLQAALETSPKCSGMGLDDNTGIILNDIYEIQSVIGAGTITLITNTGKITIYDSNTIIN